MYLSIRRVDDGRTCAAPPPQVVDLALRWVASETKIVCETSGGAAAWKVIRAKYKGGAGELADQPVPMPVDVAESQDRPLEDRPSAAALAEKSKTAAPAAPAGGRARGAPAPPTVTTTTPSSLLGALKVRSRRKEDG